MRRWSRSRQFVCFIAETSSPDNESCREVENAASNSEQSTLSIETDVAGPSAQSHSHAISIPEIALDQAGASSSTSGLQGKSLLGYRTIDTKGLTLFAVYVGPSQNISQGLVFLKLLWDTIFERIHHCTICTFMQGMYQISMEYLRQKLRLLLLKYI